MVANIVGYRIQLNSSTFGKSIMCVGTAAGLTRFILIDWLVPLNMTVMQASQSSPRTDDLEGFGAKPLTF